MDRLFSPNQYVFIKDKQMEDGVVAVNEIIDYVMKLKECLIFKVGFDKAYYLASWSFLDCMMMRFSFSLKWHSWIWAFMFGEDLSVLVHGNLIQEVSI
jgi:hypothetical protein